MFLNTCQQELDCCYCYYYCTTTEATPTLLPLLTVHVLPCNALQSVVLIC